MMDEYIGANKRFAATLTHTFIYFRKQIWVQSRRSMHEQPDIHARLMAKYPQVPEWWYGIIFCTSHNLPLHMPFFLL